MYNPPEYLNDLRPGINNPENDGEQAEDLNNTNDTQIILPCNGTSTIVIIPVPLESEGGPQNNYVNPPNATDVYQPIPKPNCSGEATAPEAAANCPETIAQKPCSGETTSTPLCLEDTTTPKPKCPEVTTTTVAPKPKCPQVTTSNTTPKSKCPEVTTTTTTTTTAKPKCPESIPPKHEYPQETTERPFFPTKQSTSKPKPISGYDGPNEVPPLNLVAKPVLGSTVVYFYKNPTTTSSKPPSYYLPSTLNPIYEEIYTERTKPPILRLKQLLFPRLYAAFHPDD